MACARGEQRGARAVWSARPKELTWVIAYALAAAAFSVAFYLWVRLGLPPTRSIALRVADFAIASLRGLAAALLGVSLALDLRLRALRSPLIGTGSLNVARRGRPHDVLVVGSGT